jgi:POT family proton-dependent oligopeptide transporter
MWLFLTYGVVTVSEICLSLLVFHLFQTCTTAINCIDGLGGWFLSTSLGGKVAGVMASFWDKIPDKKVFFGIITAAAILGDY